MPLGLAEAGLLCLVIDTKVSHAHADGGYADRRASCVRGARRLGVGALRDLGADDLPRAGRMLDDVTFRRVRHIVTENERVAPDRGTARGPRGRCASGSCWTPATAPCGTTSKSPAPN